MVYCNPYGDNNAHGTVGHSFTFRRSRGSVQLEKKPHYTFRGSTVQNIRRFSWGEYAVEWRTLRRGFYTAYQAPIPLPLSQYPYWMGKRVRGKTGMGGLFPWVMAFKLIRVQAGGQTWGQDYPALSFSCRTFSAKKWHVEGGRVQGSNILVPWGTTMSWISDTCILFAPLLSGTHDYKIFMQAYSSTFGWHPFAFWINKANRNTIAKMYALIFWDAWFGLWAGSYTTTAIKI